MVSITSSWVDKISSNPPGPFLQRANAAIHREPLATLVYGLYWSFILLFGVPLAILVLQINILRQCCTWLLWPNYTQHVRKGCNPSRHPNHELAVVITGCDSGFGRELTIWAAQAGYVVFAGCLNAESLQSFNHVCGGKVFTSLMDVTNQSQVDQTVHMVTEWFNTRNQKEEESISSSKKKHRVLHALINNAGIGIGGECDWMTIMDYQRSMDVNFLGLVRCCKAFLPLLKYQKMHNHYPHGRIINIISMAGMVGGGTGLSAYHASKHAAQVFSTNLRLELQPFGIQVITVNPSFHKTPIVDGMREALTKLWNNLPSEKQVEYGQAYFDRYLKLAVNVPLSLTWKMEVVLEQIMDCLEALTPPIELIVGSDARFFLLLTRMLPAWFVNWIFQPGRIPLTPACMQTK